MKRSRPMSTHTGTHTHTSAMQTQSRRRIRFVNSCSHQMHPADDPIMRCPCRPSRLLTAHAGSQCEVVPALPLIPSPWLPGLSSPPSARSHRSACSRASSRAALPACRRVLIRRRGCSGGGRRVPGGHARRARRPPSAPPRPCCSGQATRGGASATCHGAATASRGAATCHGRRPHSIRPIHPIRG